MWFAALGEYNHTPWLVHFCDRLLRGGEEAADVRALLRPWWAEGSRAKDVAAPKPLQIRASLYHYAFTKLSIDRASGKPVVSKDVWTRKRVGEFLPAIEGDNDSVGAFLGRYGWHRRKHANQIAAQETKLRKGKYAAVIAPRAQALRAAARAQPRVVVLVAFALPLLGPLLLRAQAGFVAYRQGAIDAYEAEFNIWIVPNN